MILVLRKGGLTAASQLELLEGNCSPCQAEPHVSSQSTGGRGRQEILSTWLWSAGE